MCTTYISLLLLLLKLQTGEEDPDTVNNLHSPSPVITDYSDWRRGSRHCSQLIFPISCHYQTHILEKRIQTLLTTYIPHLLSLLITQTGEEDPDKVNSCFLIAELEP